MSYVIRGAGEGARWEIGPTSTLVKLRGSESGGRVGMVEMEFGPGFAGPPPHQHAEVDHVWYVLGGTIRITIESRVLDLVTGASAFIPHGIAHTFANPGPEPARLLEVDSPRTLDAYFAEPARTFPAGAGSIRA